ncbi:FtsX-like permease family protein [Alkalibacillus haloalkaliphilus]|uniref:ABC3 transporter permease C-terminal domain-containing protein n=1 Tax=Alkalibacillus haloalkaliphilus TaxID=94136 RepID=A0A511W049_9BACI|nr:FtsX-like permease family protein [Alkalibacillus haloalkaliphilus]GEN44426.1 hypothetical protein AHA02nite_02020 [Alkalibacillus haloalkaliphilus]
MNLHSNRILFIVAGALLIIICTLAYSFSIMKQANEEVTQNITDFSRGSYDILVRPEDARTELERQLNLVEENYLGVGQGGISLEEWSDIKDHVDVEIAAPVASIGLFTALDRTWMMEKDPVEPVYYEVEYSTSDGYQDYTAQEKTFMYDFGEPQLRFGSDFDVSSAYFGEDIATFNFPVSYHQVVAVDPVEEGELIGQDFSPLEEKAFDPTTGYSEGEEGYASIMTLSDVSVPVEMRVTVDTLEPLTDADLTEIYDQSVEGNPMLTMAEFPEEYSELVEEHLLPQRLHNPKTLELHPSDNHYPFSEGVLYVTEDGNLSIGDPDDIPNYGQVSHYTAQQIKFNLEPVDYNIREDGSLAVEQVGVDDYYQAPIYREMHEEAIYEVDEENRPLNDSEFFAFVENGTYSITEHENQLASSPLGIYGGETPYLKSDESVTLHPSAIAGSYITTPAHGLISLEWAERVKGEEPIDAIRVRVAGIDGYDQAAAELVESLANEWEAQGYTVDIVAGASLTEMTVEVEGVGQVIQPFTTLGAADQILHSWNALQLLITILFFFVAFTFILFTFHQMLKARQKDEALLAQLGWSAKHIRKLQLKEWSRLLLIPIVIALLISSFIGIRTGNNTMLIYSVILSILVLISYVIALGLVKKKNSQVVLLGKSILTQNIFFHYPLILAASIQIFIITLMTCFLPFFLLQFIGNVTETRLGVYVHGNIEGIFLVMVVLLYIVGIITVIQSLSNLWRVRKKEISLFNTIGWSKKKIKQYFLKEVLIWGSIATGLGCVISLIALAFLVELSSHVIVGSIIPILLILGLTLLIANQSMNWFFFRGGDDHAY